MITVRRKDPMTVEPNARRRSAPRPEALNPAPQQQLVKVVQACGKATSGLTKPRKERSCYPVTSGAPVHPMEMTSSRSLLLQAYSAQPHCAWQVGPFAESAAAAAAVAATAAVVAVACFAVSALVAGQVRAWQLPWV